MDSDPREQELLPTEPRGIEAPARALRDRFCEAGVLVVSFASSSGAGKTALLEKTLTGLRENYRVAALVGNSASQNDAVRLARSRAHVGQIAIEPGCDLEAASVERALDGLNLRELDFLFLENTGSADCPSPRDLGESLRLALISVTEGEERPLECPSLLLSADVAVLAKSDLADTVDFDWPTAHANVQTVRPGVEVFALSAKTGEGMREYLDFLTERLAELRASAEV